MRRMTNIFKKMLSFCIALAVCCGILGINKAWAEDGTVVAGTTGVPANQCLITQAKSRALTNAETQAIKNAASEFGINPLYLAAICQHESGFVDSTDWGRMSASGACGVVYGPYQTQCKNNGYPQNSSVNSLRCAAFVMSSQLKWFQDAGTPLKSFEELAAAWYQPSILHLGLKATKSTGENVLVYLDRKYDEAIAAGCMPKNKNGNNCPGCDWKSSTGTCNLAPADCKRVCQYYVPKQANGTKKIGWQTMAGQFSRDRVAIAQKNGCATEGYISTASTPGDYDYSGSGGSSGSGMQQVMDVVDYESDYKCNIAENYNSIKGCIFCQLFKTIYDTASSIAHQCHETFAKSLITLLAVGLAISLAFMVLKFIADMTQKDPGMLLNMIFRKCFVVIAIMALLSMDVKSFFETFVSPVYTTGLKLSELAIDSSGVSFETPDPSPWAALNEEGFPAAMGVSMMKAIYAVQSRLEKIMAAGSNAVCIALYVESWHGYPIFPHFGYLITGIFLWLIAIVFMVTYPFLLIDSVLQFTIASSLFPVALAAMAFKITRDKLSVFKIINIFINSMFLFIFLTIVLFIILAGVDNAVTDAISKTYGNGEGYFNIEAFGWYSEAFLKLVFFLFLGKAVLEDFPAFAEDFAQALTMGQSAGNMDLGGKKVGGLFAGAATRAATMGGAKGAIVAGIAASYGQKMLQSASSSARNARHNYLMKHTEDKIAKAEAAGLATGGVVTGRTWWGQKVTRQIITNPDGSKMLQSSRKALFTRRNTVTLADQNMSIKKKFNKDGSVRESFKMRSSLTRNLFNSDGTTNQETLNKLMQTSALPKEQVQKAVMQKMFEKRMPNLGKNTILGKLSMGRNGGLKAKYSSEQLNSYKDDNGRDVFEVRRTGKDGKVRVMRMVQGEQRTRLDYEEISSDGKSKKYSSDGLIQKKETNSYDMNRDGTLNTSTSAVINGAQVDNLKTTADGMLRDGEGNVMGRVLANGNLADAQGNIIGTAQAKDLAFGADGRCLGKMTVKGTIVDKNGNTSGYLGNNGTVLDAQGQAIGNTSSSSAYNDMLKAGKKSSKSEFSNANGYKGARLYDDDGVIEDGFADEEIMYDDSEIALYQRQMKKYGDILNHRMFGV